MAFKFMPKDPALAASQPKPTPPISAPRAKSDIWENIAEPKVPIAPPAPAPTPAPPPAAAVKKTPVTIRIDSDLLAAFKKTGPGWQSRINAALRQIALQLRL